MSEETNAETPDPREAMKAALERKKAAGHKSVGGGPNAGPVTGGTHGPAAAKRQFRRKSGG